MNTRHFNAFLMTLRVLGALPVLAALLVLAFGAEARAAKATLFESMGGEGVLRTAVDRFAELVVADDRINFTFADADMNKFKKLLFEQLCELSGGPCRYTGRDMRKSHAKMKLKTAEFNALAEDLYIALGKAGVPYRQQNRLMKLLAPMQRDIVRSTTTPTSTETPAATPTP